MAFSYDLASDDSAIVRISRVRLELGDTTEGTGVKPDGTNLQDAEIQVWLDDANDAVMPAVGAACAALARQWATVADTKEGPLEQKLSQVAARWAERAATLGVGGGIGAGASFSAGVARNDGYAQAAL